MTIHIQALTFEVIIGLLDFERDRPQKVIVDMEADYDYTDQFIDYAHIVSLIQKELRSKRYELLEDALIGLKGVIVSQYPQIKKLRLKITKPDIIQNCQVALANEWNFKS